MYHLQDDMNKSISETLVVTPNTTKVTVDLVELDEMVENQPVQFIASEFEGPIVDETLFTGNFNVCNFIKNVRRTCRKWYSKDLGLCLCSWFCGDKRGD